MNPVELSQTQRERLAFLEMRVYFTGELRRADIEARFGIKPAASSRDIGAYREIAPGNLDYDSVARCYRPSEAFKPLFELQSERVLAWLLQGFDDGLNIRQGQVAPCEGVGNLIRPDLSVLGTVTRAICAKRALRINYLSLSSGSKRREIVPIALVDNGLRWHVRSYDRERKRFGDIVLTRITKAHASEGELEAHEMLPADEQWARMVDMELMPHPGIRFPQAIEADYGMDHGVLRLKARAALAGYLLRRWSIDATEDHRLDPASHHLWLRNPQTLYGVESAALAPGREAMANTNTK